MAVGKEIGFEHVGTGFSGTVVVESAGIVFVVAIELKMVTEQISELEGHKGHYELDRPVVYEITPHIRMLVHELDEHVVVQGTLL